MNQKELNEIRRRWKIDRCSISAIYGCYVNSAKEIVSQLDTSLGLLSHDEAEMYLAIMKKALSGTLGKNLIDIEFATAQVAGSEEHSILMRLKKELLHDDEAREALYRRIIDALALEDVTYCVCRLRTCLYPVEGTIEIQIYSSRIGVRVESTNLLSKFTITWCSNVSDYDAIESIALTTAALQSDFCCHFF